MHTKPHTPEARKRISDGQLAVWTERKQARAAEAASLFRALLYGVGSIRPGTPDAELCRKALKLALADGKFDPVERRTLKKWLRAIEAGHRIAAK